MTDAFNVLPCTVMRSEGVLRLILNVNLFKGMKINLEQDKFLRIVAMEDEKLAHFAIKVSYEPAIGVLSSSCSPLSSPLSLQIKPQRPTSIE